MYSAYESAENRADALIEEGRLKTKQRAERTKRIAAQQKVSFLSSGISLTGEGTTQAFFDETYRVGKEDIDLMARNYNRQIKGAWSKARTSMLKDLGSFAITAATAGAGAFGSVGAGAGGGSVATTTGSVNTMNFGGSQVGSNFGQSVLRFGGT